MVSTVPPVSNSSEVSIKDGFIGALGFVQPPKRTAAAARKIVFFRGKTNERKYPGQECITPTEPLSAAEPGKLCFCRYDFIAIYAAELPIDFFERADRATFRTLLANPVFALRQKCSQLLSRFALALQLLRRGLIIFISYTHSPDTNTSPMAAKRSIPRLYQKIPSTFFRWNPILNRRLYWELKSLFQSMPSL